MKRDYRKALWLVTLLMLPCAATEVYARDFDARLRWAEIHVVNFPLDGGITQVHVQPGDQVRSGDMLVELDQEPIEIRVRQFEAEVAAGKPVLADARRAFEQAQSLYEQTVLADDELKRARHAFEKAGAELAAARARLDHARWMLKRATAVAPWDAVVVQRDAEPGQMLVAEQRSKPLLVLAKTGAMVASADVPLAALTQVRVGQGASVMVEGKTFSATVSAIAAHPDPRASEAVYRLDARFEPGSGVFRAGQPATIRLP